MTKRNARGLKGEVEPEVMGPEDKGSRSVVVKVKLAITGHGITQDVETSSDSVLWGGDTEDDS